MIKIESIEFLDLELDVYDIQIEADNSFFVGGVVAHNSICRSLDSKIFPLSKKPKLPLHFNERSRLIPYLGETKTKGLRASKAGPVPDDTTYGDWLKRQPVSVQNEVLGVSKAKLFRKGDLPLDRFVDNSGKEYTLAELRSRDSEIWAKTFE